jgi:hypothetical protein
MYLAEMHPNDSLLFAAKFEGKLDALRLEVLAATFRSLALGLVQLTVAWGLVIILLQFIIFTRRLFDFLIQIGDTNSDKLFANLRRKL